MAARFEQARGDNQRAADYWRASLAAMPAVVANRSAGPRPRLSRREQQAAHGDHRCRPAAAARSLIRAVSRRRPSCRRCRPTGLIPTTERAPVVLTQPQPAAHQDQLITAPTTTEIPVPAPPPASRSTVPPIAGAAWRRPRIPHRRVQPNWRSRQQAAGSDGQAHTPNLQVRECRTRPAIIPRAARPIPGE